MKRCLLFGILISLVAPNVSALDHGPNDIYVRVVDVGAGLCCVVALPGDHYMIYDAGNRDYAMGDITEIIPDRYRIDLMVLSHTDADHLGAVKEICDIYDIDRIIHSGMHRTSATWAEADTAIRTETIGPNSCRDINLSLVEFPAGATYRFGEVFVTIVCGFGEPPADWDITSSGEHNNAGSIVVRLQYRDRAILFCGDAVGRHDGGPQTQCIATEKFMVEMSRAIPLKSEVIIAPHHGADNGSSVAFIEKVNPEYVILSAGHRYEHPRDFAVQRYLNSGVAGSCIFRTDLGDDEGDRERDGGRVAGHSDPVGDDDIDIVIRNDGDVVVDYR